MKRVIMIIDTRNRRKVLDICKPYLHHLTIRRQNRYRDIVVIESGFLTRLGIRYELYKAGIMVRRG